MPWNGTPGGGFTTATPWYRFAPGQDATHVAAQTGDPGSLLSHYRAWIRARHASPALARGAIRLLTGEGPVLAFVRTLGQEQILVVHNLGPDPETIALAVEGTAAEPLLVTGGASGAREGGSVRVTLPPHASAAFKL
jgi:glycosidase